ncbi:GMC family oxidoreductase [Magnetovibrio sp. PR-2]|uniref:GMC family oxidoreductase n=1 Tax=Magnetovibrio sp. PR-2 TaxID=3120356 RepID=UPI002FCE6085
MNPVDIVIVGSGASGAAAAWKLSRNTALRIVCLEAGGEQDPAHFPSTAPNWELSRHGQASSDPNERNNPADYPIDNADSPISLANFNGFGGSTILYSAHFPRFHPSDFHTQSLDGVGEDWPFGYGDLEPYFQENERMMGVAGLVGDPAYPDYENLAPPLPLGPMGRRMGDAFNHLGWHWWPSYAAINTKKLGERPSCINLGPCNTGCAQGAKGSVDVTYWPEAKSQGVEVRQNCAVQEILLGKNARAEGVRYIDQDGNEQVQPASIVVLACSGAGTPRLLLNSKSSAFPDGLLNDHGVVGRNLMLHPLAYTEAVFDDDLSSSIGPQGCSLFSHQFYETDVKRNFTRGYTMHVLRGSAPVETAVNGYMMRQIPLGPDHHKTFAKTFNHTVGIAIIAEDLPDPNNFIELDTNTADANGMAGIKVHYTLSENSQKMLKHGIERSKHLFESAGARVTSSFAPVKHTGWHIMGTARMGRDPKTSVVNEHGRAHAVNNLFIVDSSIFVTAGAVNPVATAQALTLKICDHLCDNLQEIEGAT